MVDFQNVYNREQPLQVSLLRQVYIFLLIFFSIRYDKEQKYTKIVQHFLELVTSNPSQTVTQVQLSGTLPTTFNLSAS